jgi:N6-L-threonylcarbamoyladenine synthase
LAEKYIQKHSTDKLDLFPRPLIYDKSLDWSFSGLKTAVIREIGNKKISVKMQEYYAAQIQEAIVDVLVDKTLKAVENYKVKTLLLAGGVAANSRLKQKFISEIQTKEDKIHFHVPEAKLCTDNAATIASAAFFNYKPIAWSKIDANPGLTITS